LTSLTIGNSVTTIGERAFDGCSNLVSINVNASNPNFSAESGVLFNKSKTRLITCPAGKTGSYTIPNSVTSTGNYAFSGCTGLTSVTIPNSVASIGNYTFSGCTSLTDVTNQRTTPQNVASYDFENTNVRNGTLKVPSSAVNAYKGSSWNNYFGSIVGI
jgi:hypothetical protein